MDITFDYKSKDEGLNKDVKIIILILFFILKNKIMN